MPRIRVWLRHVKPATGYPSKGHRTLEKGGGSPVVQYCDLRGMGMCRAYITGYSPGAAHESKYFVYEKV